MIKTEVKEKPTKSVRFPCLMKCKNNSGIFLVTNQDGNTIKGVWIHWGDHHPSQTICDQILNLDVNDFKPFTGQLVLENVDD